MRNVTSRFTLATIALVVALSTGARAQDNNRDDVRSVIERNEELLLQAADLVAQTNSSKARASLDAARKLHMYSVELLNGDNAVMALRVARNAREAIMQAIALAKREARAEQQAEKAMEHARALLERAQSSLDNDTRAGDGAPRKLVEEAAQQLLRARDHMREHMFEVALQLANSSAGLSTRALRLLERDDLTPERLMRELERTDALLAQVADAQLRSDPARRGRHEATELQSRARDNVHAGRLRIALEQTRRAREICARLLRASGRAGDATHDQAARAILFTDEVLASARALADAEGMADVSRALRDAFTVQEQAKNRLAAQQFDAAMRLTRRAREMTRNAVGALEGPVRLQVVEQALARSDELIDKLSSAVADGGDKDTAASLLERARKRQNEARAALESKKLRRALALTRVAANLARQGIEHTGDARR